MIGSSAFVIGFISPGKKSLWCGFCDTGVTAYIQHLTDEFSSIISGKQIRVKFYFSIIMDFV
jgi:hypothetical protein